MTRGRTNVLVEVKQAKSTYAARQTQESKSEPLSWMGKPLAYIKVFPNARVGSKAYTERCTSKLAWLYLPGFLVLGRLKQEDYCNSEASLGCRVMPCLR